MKKLTEKEIEKICFTEFGKAEGMIQAFKINQRTGEVIQIHVNNTASGYQLNKMPDIFKGYVLQHLAGASQPNLGITNVAMSTNPAANVGASGTSLNISRLAAPAYSINGFDLEYLTTFNGASFVTAIATVTGVTSASVVTVNSGTNFRNLDGVQATLNGLSNALRTNQILTVAGNVFTFVNAFEVLPQIGDKIYQAVFRVELLFNTGLTFDTGNCISIASMGPAGVTKTVDEILKIKHKISLFAS